MNPTPQDQHEALATTLDHQSDAFVEFDAWMTKQLNCLAGRWIGFATPRNVGDGSSRGPNLVSGVSKRINSKRINKD